MTEVIDHHVLVLPVDDGSGSWPDAVLQRLFNPSDPAVPAGERSTVADFWSDTTGGAIRIRGTVRPRAILPAADPDWTVVRDQVQGNRTPALAQVVRKALLAIGSSIPAGVDTVLVWAALPAHRDFASSTPVEIVPGRSVTICHVSTHSSHFTICHEIGHTLGYPHPFGLTSTDPQGRPESEYGSPHCIMGGARRSVTRRVPAWVTAPAPSPLAALWDEGGPRLSNASRLGLILERLRLAGWVPVPGLMPDWITLADELDGHHSIAAFDGPAGLPRAIAFRIEPGWLVVELRRPGSSAGFDWDAGLGLAAGDVDTHEAAGLVVHHVAAVLDLDATDQQIRDGSAWRHNRPIFQGTVPVPLGARQSLDVDAGSARFTLTSYDPVAGTAGFSVRRFPGRPSARLMVTENTVTSAYPRVGAGRYDVGGTTERCVVSSFEGFWQDEDRRVGWQAHATGFGAPEFAWRVAGVQVGGWKGQAATAEANLAHTIEVDVDVPTGPGRSTRERQRITVRATTAWNGLSLDLAPPRSYVMRDGQGRVRIPVEVFVREPGDAVHRASARGLVEVETRRLVFGVDLQQARAACQNAMTEMFRRLYEIEPEIFEGTVRVSEVVRGPDWGLAEVARLREWFDQVPKLRLAAEELPVGQQVLQLKKLGRQRLDPR